MKTATFRTLTTEQLKKAMNGTIAGHEAGNNRRKLIAACKIAGHQPSRIAMEFGQ
jgi:hypothetical protein